MSHITHFQILILSLLLEWTSGIVELNKIAITNGLIIINTPRGRQGKDTIRVAEAVSELQGENVRLMRRMEALSQKIAFLRSRSEGGTRGMLS